MQYVSYLRIAAVLTVAASQFVGAADGVWTNLTDGGLWSAGGNWQDEVVASGAGSTAFFDELDLTADTTVRLDAPTTIGNLTFGDTDTTSAADWVLNNNDNADNQLTLDGVAPTITVNALGNDSKVEIRTGINGVNGLIKAGVGTLALAQTNSYSGATAVTGGELRLNRPSNFSNFSEPVQNGLALWLDATHGVTTNAAGNVTEWADRSGNNHDAYNNAATGPTVTADINGLPTLRFTRASAQYLEGGGLRNMDEVTIFMVHKVATLTPSDYYALLATDTTSSTSYGGGVHYNIEKSLKINFYLGGSDPSRCDSDSLAVAEVPVIYEALHYTNACYHYKNGVYDGGVSRTVKQKRLDDYRIGAWNNSRYYDGSMGEIIIYNRALTTAERAQVYAYLNAKWMNPSGIDTPPEGESSIMAVDAQVTVDADAVLSLSGQNHTLGTLQGGGVVSNGMVTAVIQPGGASEIGSLQLAQATLAGTLVVDVNGSECDALHVNGDLDLSGLTLCFSDAEYPRASKAYVLATYTGVLTAPFGEVDLPGSWTVSYATAQTVKLICNSGTTILVR